MECKKQTLTQFLMDSSAGTPRNRKSQQTVIFISGSRMASCTGQTGDLLPVGGRAVWLNSSTSVWCWLFCCLWCERLAETERGVSGVGFLKRTSGDSKRGQPDLSASHCDEKSRGVVVFLSPSLHYYPHTFIN